jgi:hypothetical protein
MLEFALPAIGAGLYSAHFVMRYASSPLQVFPLKCKVAAAFVENRAAPADRLLFESKWLLHHATFPACVNPGVRLIAVRTSS